MDPLNKNLITTKDAGELAGYTADYLARLVRSGEIVGERTGHTWLIDRSSLELFLEKQKVRKSERAQELARARAKEYQAHQQTPKSSPVPVSVPRRYRAPHDFGHVPFRSHAFALSLALAVVVSGALVACSPVVPQVAGEVALVAQETASGFGETFSTAPVDFISRINMTNAAMQERVSHVMLTVAGGTYAASPLLAKLDLSSSQERLEKNYRAPVFASAGTTMSQLGSIAMTMDGVQASILDSYEFLTTPASVGELLFHTYASVGTVAYSAITSTFSTYRSFIVTAGEKSLGVAIATQESFPKLSHFINQMNLALGDAVINATHTAINSDVTIAYGLATLAPASAQATFTSISKIGDVLANVTAKVPALVATTYLSVTALPATVAPEVAQGIFGAEYTASSYFIHATNGLSEGYLALVKGAGSTLYAVVTSASSLSSLANVWVGIHPVTTTFTLSTW